MTPGLRLTLRAEPDQRVDLSALVPDRLAGLDRAGVERIAIATTRAALVVGDLFRVQMGDPASVVIEGGSERFDRVGAGMTQGSITVEGSVGVEAGRRMHGGTLAIAGKAGPFAASGMSAGRIEIAGDAGAFLGAPLAGEPAGMAGGVVIVRGDAAERAGDRLRRGLILVEGTAGPEAASRMIAGTLIACGGAGPRPGILMRRGTLVLGRIPAPLPTFVEAGAPAPVFIRLLARTLADDSRRAARLVQSLAARLVGDMAGLGKGEILLAR